MANFKRKKSRYNVRCGICTPRVNRSGKERTKPSDRRRMQDHPSE